MKKPLANITAHTVPLILSLALPWSPVLEADILFQEGFETDGLGSRYTATGIFSDAENDYFIRTDGITGASGIPAYTGYGGDWFWAAEDIDSIDNQAGVAVLDFSGIALGEFPEIQISIDIGAGSQSDFDSLDDFVLVQYRIDAGAWSNALAFQNDGTTYHAALYQDTDFDGIGDGQILDLELQSFTSLAIPVSGNFLDLRIDTVLNSGNEAVAFDNIEVTGIPEPAATSLFVGTLACVLIFLRRNFLPLREDESQA